jgi:hypothetical protein
MDINILVHNVMHKHDGLLTNKRKQTKGPSKIKLLGLLIIKISQLSIWFPCLVLYNDFLAPKTSPH